MICDSCKNEIDPNVCGCGQAIDGSLHDGHAPVPMGCDCFRAPKKKWKRIISTKVAPMHRGGWKGVYDALRAALTGASRFEVAREITLSFWAATEDDTEIKTQFEVNDVRATANSYAPGFTMTPLQMIAEWRKGCSNCEGFVALRSLGVLVDPIECRTCTRALIDMIERHQRSLLVAGER